MTRRRDIERTLRAGIRSGLYPVGTRLPSTRTLAAEFGVARGTVVSVYAQLASEGWIRTRARGTTIVAPNAGHALHVPASATPAQRVARFDLRPGAPDVTEFPLNAWLASLRRAPGRRPTIFGYSDPRGSIDLRNVLATYLARARGVTVDPRTSPALTRTLLLRPGTTAWSW